MAGCLNLLVPEVSCDVSDKKRAPYDPLTSNIIFLYLKYVKCVEGGTGLTRAHNVQGVRGCASRPHGHEILSSLVFLFFGGKIYITKIISTRFLYIS